MVGSYKSWLCGSIWIPLTMPHHAQPPAATALPVLWRGSTGIATLSAGDGECVAELPLVELPLVPRLVRGSWLRRAGVFGYVCHGCLEGMFNNVIFS